MAQKKKAKIAKKILEDLIKKNGAKCDSCSRDKWLTVEHIIPVSILKDMGFSTEEMYEDNENLRILCRICNAQKGGHLDFNDSRTKKLLLKYLERF